MNSTETDFPEIPFYDAAYRALEEPHGTRAMRHIEQMLDLATEYAEQLAGTALTNKPRDIAARGLMFLASDDRSPVEQFRALHAPDAYSHRCDRHAQLLRIRLWRMHKLADERGLD